MLGIAHAWALRPHKRAGLLRKIRNFQLATCKISFWGLSGFSKKADRIKTPATPADFYRKARRHTKRNQNRSATTFLRFLVKFQTQTQVLTEIEVFSLRRGGNSRKGCRKVDRFHSGGFRQSPTSTRGPFRLLSWIEWPTCTFVWSESKHRVSAGSWVLEDAAATPERTRCLRSNLHRISSKIWKFSDIDHLDFLDFTFCQIQRKPNNTNTKQHNNSPFPYFNITHYNHIRRI